MTKTKAYTVKIEMIGSIYTTSGWVGGLKKTVVVDANDDAAVLRACYGDRNSLHYGKFAADHIVSTVRI